MNDANDSDTNLPAATHRPSGRFERCACGWPLPAKVRIGRLVIMRNVTEPAEGKNVEAEIHVTCPTCARVYSFDRNATCMKSELVFEVCGDKKAIGQA